MKRRGAALTVAWLAAGTVFGLPFAAAGPARHQHHPAKTIAPVKIAWYDAARASDAVPASPMPGVGKGDIVVSGTTVNVSQLPIPGASTVPVISRVTAFTALDFRIPKGATPTTLSLELTGFSSTRISSKLPSGVTPVACPTTSRWKSGDQQAIADAPKYDCKKLSSIGQLSRDGTSIVFNGINRLIRGRTLAFVVLPGTLGFDRMVFDKPGSRTLSLLRFSTPPVPVTSTPPVPATTDSPVPSSVAPPTQTGGVSIPVPPAPAASAAPGPVSPPQVATTSTTAVQPLAASPLDDHRARLAAIALLVALVVTTLWLAVTDSSGRAFTTLRVIRALSAGGPLPELPVKEWGVGRFKAPRDGRPPTI